MEPVDVVQRTCRRGARRALFLRLGKVLYPVRGAGQDRRHSKVRVEPVARRIDSFESVSEPGKHNGPKVVETILDLCEEVRSAKWCREMIDQLLGSLIGKRLLIFDYDGTVADTSPLHARAFAEVLGPLGVRFDYSEIAGLKTSDAIESCFRAAGLAASGFDLASLVAEKQQRVRRLIVDELQPNLEIGAFLHWARPRYRLSLVTSGSRGSVELALQKIGYANLFDPIICADDVQCAKPAADGMIKALELTQTRLDEALVFEDSLVGFEASRAAGLAFIDVRTVDWSAVMKANA
jgi:HAD superfamily hydrolase (TIGR01509 family)